MNQIYIPRTLVPETKKRSGPVPPPLPPGHEPPPSPSLRVGVSEFATIPGGGPYTRRWSHPSCAQRLCVCVCLCVCARARVFVCGSPCIADASSELLNCARTRVHLDKRDRKRYG